MTTQSTLLTLLGLGLPPYSARGLKQSLAPIPAATQQKRTINGDLADVSDVIFQKYESTITGSDVDPPAFDSMWPGMVLTVGCIKELATMSDTTEGTTEGDLNLGRPAVTGSIRTADGFTFYRPVLSMMVTGWNTDEDEWGRVTDWSLNLEEV